MFVFTRMLESVIPLWRDSDMDVKHTIILRLAILMLFFPLPELECVPLLEACMKVVARESDFGSVELNNKNRVTKWFCFYSLGLALLIRLKPVHDYDSPDLDRAIEYLNVCAFMSHNNGPVELHKQLAGSYFTHFEHF